ncbi:TerB family tellurite resistance protein [Vreelandella piezotolerans]|uniref:TerB family tellurite resistance protein n=1 Tax=Vreelandella piezotolerans TaxID=2609667 RepID=A0ABQ6XBH8_9GAMM|nr:TerB family tellurite resistance protein [Halomonas piezotolerans]KAE8438877.1 TerB family tellurite resistance protein [Halomonas piezotolerans]QJA25328.1 TerB family tellurite resistance protein [Halomonas piezotolerans]
MLDAIHSFFQQALSAPEQRDDQSLTLELASAALLCEVMRADYDQSDVERAALKQMLMARYRLDEQDVSQLMALAEAEVDDAVDHYQFVSLIKQHYDYDQRLELVNLMWELAWADGSLDPLEEHRIRRLADLLYVSHSDFIRSKLSHSPDESVIHPNTHGKGAPRRP